MNLKNRTAVVTGACGFIGSHLVEHLVSLGMKVKALAFYDARGSIGWLSDIPQKTMKSVKVISGDIRDTEQMNSLIAGGDIVFHLAALIGIPYSYIAPRSYVETNITGTLNILQAARTNKAARLLVISTSEVYGTAITVPIPESHPLQAQSPYSASKIAAEKMAESFHKSFEMPVTVIRPFNTFGPRQSARAVIPTVLMQALAGRSIIRIGDPTTTRDFNYVKDTAAGMARIAACDRTIGLTVNIGTGIDVPVTEVIKEAGRIVGRRIKTKCDSRRIRPAASEVRRLQADSALLQKLTGWKPPFRLAEGMKETADWMKLHMDSYNADRYYV